MSSTIDYQFKQEYLIKKVNLEVSVEIIWNNKFCCRSELQLVLIIDEIIVLR